VLGVECWVLGFNAWVWQQILLTLFTLNALKAGASLYLLVLFISSRGEKLILKLMVSPGSGRFC